MKQIVTISGKAQAGKDYIATELGKLLESYDNKVLVIHYADYLKYLCESYFGWDGNKDEVGREILQRVGTDVVRKTLPEFWVRNVCQFIEVFWNEYDYFLIPDCRFPDEIEVPIDLFGKEFVSSVLVKRINASGFQFENSLTYEQNHHASETALDNRLDLFDVLVCNYGFEGGDITSAISEIVKHLMLKEKL